MAMPLDVRRRIFWRLLLLQATWSFERMHGLGFAHAIEPWLERLYPQRDQRVKALARHTEYFNTQPHMASLVLGVVCKLEEQGDKERIRRVKKALGASLAGLGDSFFWAALRPAAAAAGLAAGLLALEAGRLSAGLWTAAVYLLVFNIPALWLRWNGIALGYEWGEQLPAHLKAFAVRSWVSRLRFAGSLAAAALGVLVLAGVEPGQKLVCALSLGVFLLLYFVLMDRVSALRLYAATCLVGFLSAAAGWF